MAKQKTGTKTTKRGKAKATQDRPARKAFAYGERVAPVVDAVKSLGGSASVAELFETLYDGDDGQFATQRRVAATVRAQRGNDAKLENVGGVIKLIKRSRKVTKRQSVSRKKTRKSS